MMKMMIVSLTHKKSNFLLDICGIIKSIMVDLFQSLYFTLETLEYLGQNIDRPGFCCIIVGDGSHKICRLQPVDEEGEVLNLLVDRKMCCISGQRGLMYYLWLEEEDVVFLMEGNIQNF